MNVLKKPLFYLGSFLACTVMAMTTGCASGGFKLTREYARWVNTKHIVLRVILYLLTFVVFTITLLIDAVLFNTMDFWEGRVSSGTYEFREGEKTFHVKHEVLPENQRKQSTITITTDNQQDTQVVTLTETMTGEVELRHNGKLQARVSDLTTLPVATFFNDQGQALRKDLGLLTPSFAVTK